MTFTEFELIDRYFKNLTKVSSDVLCGIGDDAAIIKFPSNEELVVSTDTLVSGTHFLSSTSAYDIGFKSMAVNLSDMAAMAALPRWVTLSLTLPAIDESWMQQFAKGVSALAEKYSVDLIGGDLARGPLSITIQIMGAVPMGTAVKRSGAKPGDYIFVSGCLGGAAYAFKVLNGEIDLADGLPEYCKDRLLRPMPRVEMGQKLRGLASAAIDLSDGLAADLGHILRASAVGAIIELEKVPICEGLANNLENDLLWQTTLCSGDDYELCFTVPKGDADMLERELSTLQYPCICIGEIVDGNEVSWLLPDGSNYELQSVGFQHF